MPREQRDWLELTQSIHQNRASNALFYKPVCVIAAIDLADTGGLVSDMIYAELIIRKFDQYVSIAYPKRASKGWWPLWFLANDGLWTFSKKGKQLSKSDLSIRPTTKNKTLQRFDRQAIAPDYRALWDSVPQRKVLRDHMLAIMNRYPESKILVRALFDPNLTNDPARSPSETSVDDYFNELSGQGDLFQESVVKVEPAGPPQSTAAVRRNLAAFDISALPTISAVGPSLEITGVTPIAISASPHRDVTRAQVALYNALRQKCVLLDHMAANSNRAAHLRPALGGMIEALEGEPDQSSGYLIWPHGNTLRRLLSAEMRGRNNDDPDDPPLTDRMLELLTDVVEQFNVYAMADTLVALLDRSKAGPANRSEFNRSLDAGSELVSELRKSPELVTPEATKVLETATQNALNAKATPGFDADQAVANAVEIHRNSAGGILRNAYLELKKFVARGRGAIKPTIDGALKQSGAELVKLLPISYLVHSAQNAFTALWHGTTSFEVVNSFINLVREVFAFFRG